MIADFEQFQAVLASVNGEIRKVIIGQEAAVRQAIIVLLSGQHALIVEVAPALAIERVIDLALRAVPAVEPGILFVERQFGVLEVHGRDLEDVRRAGQAILDGLGADQRAALCHG